MLTFKQPFIALVDDDEDERYFMNLAFSKIGWIDYVKFFSSSDQLFFYLKNLPEISYPSLIVLDYSMPKIDGAEALVYLKKQEDYKKIPVSIFSSNMHALLKEQLLTLGAHSCHAKTFEISEAVKLAATFKELAEGNKVTF